MHAESSIPTKFGQWSLQRIGQYDNGKSSFALIDPEGRERMFGPADDFASLLDGMMSALEAKAKAEGGAR